jgi:hypothetical protein
LKDGSIEINRSFLHELIRAVAAATLNVEQAKPPITRLRGLGNITWAGLGLDPIRVARAGMCFASTRYPDLLAPSAHATLGRERSRTIKASNVSASCHLFLQVVGAPRFPVSCRLLASWIAAPAGSSGCRRQTARPTGRAHWPPWHPNHENVYCVHLLKFDDGISISKIVRRYL